jgi:hypothetical protein
VVAAVEGHEPGTGDRRSQAAGLLERHP